MTSNTILFFYEEISLNLDESKLNSWLRSVITEHQKELETLNYIFCSDEYLLDINRKYLNHDYYTDVIGFPYAQEHIEGDIYISIDRVRENALALKTSFENELNRVIVHGLLHFLGYEDKTPETKEQMRQKENHYLNQFSV